MDLNGTVTWDNKSDATYYAAAGYTINQHVRIGAEVNYFRTQNVLVSALGSGVSGTVIFWNAAIAYYPAVSRNFWIKGDLGYANLIGARNIVSGLRVQIGKAPAQP